MSRVVQIDNATREIVLAERAEVADTPWKRMKGLLGRNGLEQGQGLIIRPCQGVHTWFMAFPIDVLHVDKHHVIRRIQHNMPPNRIGPVVWSAKYVVELPAGAAAAASTEVGDKLLLS
jgi:uncharacterized membrane protein (UPF0127 family)